MGQGQAPDTLIVQAAPHDHRSSEDMFLAWVLSLPHTANIAEEARIEIARLDRINSDCRATMRLREMLVQASGHHLWLSRGRSRSRH